MQRVVGLACGLLLGGAVCSAGQPAFTSLRVFGDSASSTTNSTGAPFYHGHRYSNGSMWVEVLAQWMQIPFDLTHWNCSFFGHYSPVLLNNIQNYAPPPDVGTALYVVWVGNADFVWNIQNLNPYNAGNLLQWNSANHQWLTNHFRVMTNLYAKGVRALIMPNVVDLTFTPDYRGLSLAEKAFIRQQTTNFNQSFHALVHTTAASLPELTVWTPDTFTLFDNVLANPAQYGMVNPGVGALDDGQFALNGPGAYYVFWDYLHPTALFQMYMADTVFRLLSPVRIEKVTPAGASNTLRMVNLPAYRPGQLRGTTNFNTWATVQTFTPTNTTQEALVPRSAAMEFYQLAFPFNWTWPGVVP